MIVCHCRVVTDRPSPTRVVRGARSLRTFCRATGAGQDCGACVFSLKRLMCEHGVLASVELLSEVDVAAS